MRCGKSPHGLRRTRTRRYRPSRRSAPFQEQAGSFVTSNSRQQRGTRQTLHVSDVLSGEERHPMPASRKAEGLPVTKQVPMTGLECPLPVRTAY